MSGDAPIGGTMGCGHSAASEPGHEDVLSTFTEVFAETESIHFQLIELGGATYAWVGTDDARQDSLAVGVPMDKGSLPASATQLIGGSSDNASQTLAQRLAKRIGHPVFVSMNLRDDLEMRAFAERHLLAALLKKRTGTTAPATATEKVNVYLLATAASSTSATSTPPPQAGAASATAPQPQALGDGVAVGARTHEVFESAEALGASAAAMLLSASREAIAARGYFSVALSGGSIPKLLAPSLLSAAPSAQFDKWHVFMADERHVPLTDADSNLGEWQERLLKHIGVPPAQVYAMDDTVPVEEAARAYERALVRVVGGTEGASTLADPPRIDAVVLGMGPDGHTASLFPDHPLLSEEGCWVAPISDSPKPPPRRITLTLPALNAARRCLFVVTGGSKSGVVRRAFAPEPDVPAGLVLATLRTHWFLDAPAAAELQEETEKQEAMYS